MTRGYHGKLLLCVGLGRPGCLPELDFGLVIFAFSLHHRLTQPR